MIKYLKPSARLAASERSREECPPEELDGLEMHSPNRRAWSRGEPSYLLPTQATFKEPRIGTGEVRCIASPGSRIRRSSILPTL